MVALTETSTVQHGLLKKKKSCCSNIVLFYHNLYIETVQEGRKDASMGLSPQSLLLSITGTPCSPCFLSEHCELKFILTNPSPFPSKTHSSPCWTAAPSPPMMGCRGPRAPAQPPGGWQPHRVPGLRFPAQQK